MANYLANIAARTLNPTPEVRPRFRGLFDPPAAYIEKPIDQAQDRIEPRFTQVHTVREIAGPPMPSRPDHNKQTIETEFRNSQPRSDNSLKTNRTRIDEASSEPVRLTVTPDSQTSVSTPQSEAVAIPPPRRSDEDQTALRTIRDDQVVDRKRLDGNVPQSPGTTFVDSEKHEDSRNNLHVERVIERETKTIVTEKTIASPPVPLKSKDIRGSDQPSAFEPSRQAAKPSLIQPRIESRREISTQNPVVQNKLRQSEPTVHVTIGRIEVRAVQQPPAAAKSRQSQPVMNLDEYLKQRSQGGAR